MSITLSVSGGTLSATTATIAKGSTESSAITVTQTGAGQTTVSLGAAPRVPFSSPFAGIQTAVGDPLVLFSTQNRSPVAQGTILLPRPLLLAAQRQLLTSQAIPVILMGTHSRTKRIPITLLL